MFNKSKPVWLMIIGVEGSGKSTLARYIFSLPKDVRIRLLGDNAVFDATYSDHLLAYTLQKFLIKVGRKEVHVYPDGSEIVEPDYGVVARLFPLWYILQIVSFFIYSLKNLLRAIFGSIVVWERGPYSFLSYIACMELYLRLRRLRKNINYSYTLFTARILYGFLRRIPHSVVYLSCDFDIAKERQSGRGTPAIPRWIMLFRSLVERRFLRDYFTFAPLIEIDTTRRKPLQILIDVIKMLNHHR